LFIQTGSALDTLPVDFNNSGLLNNIIGENRASIDYDTGLITFNDYPEFYLV
jgi:hypothetical protein